MDVQTGARRSQQLDCALQPGHHLRGGWQLRHHPGLPDQQGDADHEEHLHRQPGHLRHPPLHLHHATHACGSPHKGQKENLFCKHVCKSANNSHLKVLSQFLLKFSSWWNLHRRKVKSNPMRHYIINDRYQKFPNPYPICFISYIMWKYFLNFVLLCNRQFGQGDNWIWSWFWFAFIPKMIYFLDFAASTGPWGRTWSTSASWSGPPRPAASSSRPSPSSWSRWTDSSSLFNRRQSRSQLHRLSSIISNRFYLNVRHSFSPLLLSSCPPFFPLRCFSSQNWMSRGASSLETLIHIVTRSEIIGLNLLLLS